MTLAYPCPFGVQPGLDWVIKPDKAKDSTTGNPFIQEHTNFRGPNKLFNQQNLYLIHTLGLARQLLRAQETVLCIIFRPNFRKLWTLPSYYNRHSHETILYIRLTEKFIPFFQDESSISNPAGQKRLHFAGIAQYTYELRTVSS